jgi:UDP-glucose 4-epimerase
MKILVTGGAGFIGTNLIKKLLSEGHEVHSLDDYETGLEENHQEKGIYHRNDITNINTMDKDFDYIYHLAALARIQQSFNDPQETFRVNSVGTQRVCEFARLTGAKLIYAGSSSRWCDPHISPYSTSKFIGEEIIKMYRRTYGLDMEIARFYNVYGPHEIVDGTWAAVIGIWRNQVKKGEKITIVGDGEQRRDFTHVDDIVEGLFRIGFKDIKHEDAWELGTGINYSINEVYQMFRERFGADFINIPDQPGNYRKTLRENDDSLDRLGWKPSDKLKDYIFSLGK